MKIKSEVLFTFADLRGADLEGADLSGIDLSNSVAEEINTLSRKYVTFPPALHYKNEDIIVARNVHIAMF